MTPAQFWAIAQVLRIQLPNREAARRVLVDGITQIRAGEETGLSRQSVGNSVGRIQRAHDLMIAAYIAPIVEPEPPPPSQRGATVRIIPGKITS